MKKKSMVLVESKNYKVKEILQGDIVLIEFLDGRKGIFAQDASELLLTFDADALYYEVNGLVSIKEGNKLQVYDLNERKVFVKPTLIVKNLRMGYILKDEGTGKLFIFNEVYKDCMSLLFDDIIPLGCNYFKVGKDSKFGIYKLGKGFVVDIEYDEITAIDKDNKNYVLVTGGQKEIFSTINNQIIPQSYDTIFCEGEIVVGCSQECFGKLYDFYYYNQELGEYDTLDSIACDKVENIYFKNGTGYILYKEDKVGKKKMIDLYVDYCSVPFLRGEYDTVNPMLVTPDERLSLAAIDSDREIEKIIPMDKFEHLGGCYYYVIENGLGSVIKKSVGQWQVIVNGIKLLTSCCSENTNIKGYMYSDGEKEGILFIDGENENIALTGLYDNVRNVGLKNVIIEDDNKNGLIQNERATLPVNYNKIYASRPSEEDNIIYFAFQKNEGEKYGLARTFKEGTGFMKIGEYDNVTFYDDIMVLQNSDIQLVYDYQGKCLASFNGQVFIDRNYMDYEAHTYLVDGDKWLYNDGKFMRRPTLEENRYISAYEYKYGTVVVDSYDKEEHDKACASIEDIADKDANAILRSYYMKKPVLHEKYPKLVRKK